MESINYTFKKGVAKLRKILFTICNKSVLFFAPLFLKVDFYKS